MEGVVAIILHNKLITEIQNLGITPFVKTKHSDNKRMAFVTPTLGGVVGYMFNVPLENFSLVSRRHQLQMKYLKFRPKLGVQGRSSEDFPDTKQMLSLLNHSDPLIRVSDSQVLCITKMA